MAPTLPAVQPAIPDDPEEPSGTVVDEAVLAQRRERRAGQDQQPLLERSAAAEREVAQLEARAQELGGELERATAERNDAVRRLGASEIALRSAQQHGFAEEQQRIDAEADLAGARREADTLRVNLDAARARVAELERELRATHGRHETELAALQELADGLTERLEAEGQAREAALAEAGASAQVAGETPPALPAAPDVAELADADEDFAALAARVAAAQRRADATASALGAARSRSQRDAEELAAARRTITALQGSVAALGQEGEARSAGAAEALAAVRGERDELAAQVGVIETTVTELSERFEATLTAMQQRVEEEQAARRAAEAALGGVRAQLVAEVAGERDALRARVAGMLRELDVGLARLRGLSPAAAAPALAAPRAGAAHATPATGPAAAPGRTVADPPKPAGALPLRPPAPEPPVSLPTDLRAELERLNAFLGAAEPAEGAQDVIAGLARAAERLRAQPTQGAPDDGLRATTAAPQTESRLPALRDAPAVPASGPRPAWLAALVQRIALTEPAAAAELIVALLPVPGRRVGGPVSFDLAVTGTAPVRVTAGHGRVDVRPVQGPDAAGTVDFRVAGAPDVLAPLVAGGVRWPVRIPAELQVEGRRRRLRRVLRSMRRPVLVADLRAAGAAIDPAVILRALAAAVEPAWVRGHEFAVVFEAIDGPRAWRVEVSGAGVQVHAPEPAAATAADAGATVVEPAATAVEPAATVRGTADGLLALVAGDRRGPAPAPDVLGSQPAVTFLLGWWDRAQGLPARTV
jgi:hypothetical protein